MLRFGPKKSAYYIGMSRNLPLLPVYYFDCDSTRGACVAYNAGIAIVTHNRMAIVENYRRENNRRIFRLSAVLPCIDRFDELRRVLVDRPLITAEQLKQIAMRRDTSCAIL